MGEKGLGTAGNSRYSRAMRERQANRRFQFCRFEASHDTGNAREALRNG